MNPRSCLCIVVFFLSFIPALIFYWLGAKRKEGSSPAKKKKGQKDYKASSQLAVLCLLHFFAVISYVCPKFQKLVFGFYSTTFPLFCTIFFI